MRLYFAAMTPKGPKDERKIPAEKILLSYYDIHLSPIPFRKETWKMVVEGRRRNESIPRDLAT